MNNKHFTNIVSTIFGKFASFEFPSFIQKLITNKYISMFDIDLSNYPDKKSYKTLNELFTRKMLKTTKINEDKNIFISPCDALITDCGKYKDSILLQIKGMEYNINEFLTSYCSHLKNIQVGSYINFYLSPKDYHRYHSPCDLEVQKLIKIPGKLYPVNLKFLYEKDNLFIENERVILECKTKNDKILYLVFVGALNVGAITFKFEDSLYERKNGIEIINYKENEVVMQKGEELGCFMMGSTIVSISEESLLTLSIETGDNVKFGDNIASVKGTSKN